jgi:hypothetical protein
MPPPAYLVCLFMLLAIGCRDASPPRSSPATSSNANDEQAKAPQIDTRAPQANSQPPTQAKWIPPANPDPQAILNEAHHDTMARRYDEALAKHEWFIRNASDIDRADHGARLPAAFSSWKQLADVYPPAKTKLIEIRDEANEKVTSDDNAVESFNVFAAINSVLGEDQNTVALFKTLDKDNSQSAAEAFEAARPALIKAGELQLCGTYVDPKEYPRLVEKYHRMLNLPADPKVDEHQTEFAQKGFSNSVTTLVALLVLSDRKADAERIAADAKTVWPDKSFVEALDKALKGEVP